jgi:hypothetical protein
MRRRGNVGGSFSDLKKIDDAIGLVIELEKGLTMEHNDQPVNLFPHHENLGFGTRAVHAGQAPDPTSGSSNPSNHSHFVPRSSCCIFWKYFCAPTIA